ncbi:putative phosphodiesterase [Variovorax boronicumulans]|uniref:metallophosphoesterase family protein n=1 Tax=Variovorax TaxID=34072 RepID=UPI002783313E|nr:MULTISPECIES: metallophosphoesterase family protein [Variovorax]MDQ0032784.1 putative phosphodiesterase [Variovorax boronicumulans]MDQ0609374.1 putative phosphodiesterase [Variovorax sp. W1I1]
MRIAFVSDIHGNLPALEAVVEDIERRGVDDIVNLGDSLSGPLMPLETAQFLMAQDWVQLAGNHERQLLTVPPDKRGASDAFAHARLGAKEFDWMASLGHTHRFSADVMLCHGTPASDLEYFLETVEPDDFRTATQAEIDARLGDIDAALIACGHTHVPRVARASSGQLIVNPGSVGLPAYGDIHPYPHAVETGSPHARYAIVEQRDGDWTARLITVPYDHTAMAKLALENGRPDWAHALKTGRMP